VWGLNPGDYYVSAVTRIDIPFGGGGRGGPGRGGPGTPAIAGIASAVGGLLGGNVAALIGGPGDDQDRLSYAPTYFPGVASINEARSVTVGVSQEVLDIDFSLQLVRTSRISGHVDNPDGTRPSGGNVNLTPEGAAGGRGNLGTASGRASTGTAASHQQRAAGPLHAAGPQQRQRGPAVGVPAARRPAAAISRTSR
jgi:hypothetical protein